MKTLRELFLKLPYDGFVRNQLRDFNLSSGRGRKAPSVKNLAESFGVEIRQIRMPMSFAGRLVADCFTRSGFAIEVNDRHSVESRRFTVLHELGHMLLGHVDATDIFLAPAHLNRGEDEFYIDATQEHEANAFADVLLFGDGAIESAYSLHHGDRKRLAYVFGVTKPMVEIAIRKYGVERRK
ncbi:MAG: ImmA/IrrE family metallo-endopeptidase [Paracoccaceae bacterium]